MKPETETEEDNPLTCVEKIVVFLVFSILFVWLIALITDPWTERWRAEETCREMRDVGGKAHVIAKIGGYYSWKESQEVNYFCQSEPADTSKGEAELPF